MPTLSGNTVLEHPETGQRVTLRAGQELPAWAEDLVGDHLLAETETDEPADQKSLDDMKVAELKQHAAAKQIDLGGATKKDEILAVIKAAEASA